MPKCDFNKAAKQSFTYVLSKKLFVRISQTFTGKQSCTEVCF